MGWRETSRAQRFVPTLDATRQLPDILGEKNKSKIPLPHHWFGSVHLNGAALFRARSILVSA
jgi:hypothetical protein